MISKLSLKMCSLSHFFKYILIYDFTAYYFILGAKHEICLICPILANKLGRPANFVIVNNGIICDSVAMLIAFSLNYACRSYLKCVHVY